jgi:2-methylcitrate dehydratase PrpD
MKVTETLARYALEASYRSFPREVVHQAKRCFLDLIGVALGGSRQPRQDPSEDRTGIRKSQATVWGHGLKTSVAQAALVNGAMAHALDYDDTHVRGMGHPSAPLIPALLAVAERKGASGKAALEAFIAGFEVATRIGEGMGVKHYNRGWHATATFGRFGAAVAAGKLLGLDLEQMKQAMGLAGTQAGRAAPGLRNHDQALPSREIGFRRSSQPSWPSGASLAPQHHRGKERIPRGPGEDSGWNPW